MHRPRVKKGCSLLGTEHPYVQQKHYSERKLLNESAASAAMLLISEEWERGILVMKAH